jgi:hypothetical protein
MTASEPRYYAGVAKLHETSDIESANRLIGEGWELLSIKERSVSVVGKDGTFATSIAPAFILGWSEVPKEVPKPTEPPAPQHPAPQPQTPTVEQRLEALSWKEAASRKCDFVKDPPADLLAAVRGAKEGIKGQAHHFTAHATDAVLFRYKRGDKK